MSIAFLKVSLLFDLYEIKTIKYMENISNFAVGFISTIALFLVLQSAQADIANRNATPKEISKIVEVLKQNDCTVVGNVDYVKGIGFKAEDVQCDNGKKYNVFLDKNFNITSRK